MYWSYYLIVCEFIFITVPIIVIIIIWIMGAGCWGEVGGICSEFGWIHIFEYYCMENYYIFVFKNAVPLKSEWQDVRLFACFHDHKSMQAQASVCHVNHCQQVQKEEHSWTCLCHHQQLSARPSLWDQRPLTPLHRINSSCPGRPYKNSPFTHSLYI